MISYLRQHTDKRFPFNRLGAYLGGLQRGAEHLHQVHYFRLLRIITAFLLGAKRDKQPVVAQRQRQTGRAIELVLGRPQIIGASDMVKTLGVFPRPAKVF